MYVLYLSVDLIMVAVSERAFKCNSDDKCYMSTQNIVICCIIYLLCVIRYVSNDISVINSQ